MKDEYDFKGGERGKFYRPNTRLEMPIYLEDGVRSYLSQRAASKGVSLSDMVNDLLRREIEIIEAVQ
jgi:hypothetical protein